MNRIMFSVLLVCSLATLGMAGNIQYLRSTGNVTGVSDRAVEENATYGVVVIPESVEAIQWPAPAGCPSGLPEWTRVVDPLLVTVTGSGMEVRPELSGFFFTSTSPLLTGCHLVQDLSTLRALVRTAIAAGTSDFHTIQGFAPYQDWYDMQCRGSESNANCVTTKANLDAMQPFVPGRGQMVTETGYGATLATDAQAFKVLKGW